MQKNENSDGAEFWLSALRRYRSCEYSTITRDGTPMTWPMWPFVDDRRVLVNTGFAYPLKADNARRNPKIAISFTDPEDGGPGAPKLVLQGTARVLDDDLQANTDSYHRYLLKNGSTALKLALRSPLRSVFGWYLVRIWVELQPIRIFGLGGSSVDLLFGTKEPRAAELPPAPSREVERLSRSQLSEAKGYSRGYDSVVVTVADSGGYPFSTRMRFRWEQDDVLVDRGDDLPVPVGPACLVFHRNAAHVARAETFTLRGAFVTEGRFVPARLVGFLGSTGPKPRFADILAKRRALHRNLAARGKEMPRLSLDAG